jgi:hypothetical protein
MTAVTVGLGGGVAVAAIAACRMFAVMALVASIVAVNKTFFAAVSLA